MARHALDEALAALEQRAGAAAPGGWPEVQERLAAAHPTADGLPRRLSADVGRVPDARHRGASRQLARVSDSLRADSGAHARRGAVPLLPLLPLTGAVRPAAGPRLRRHADRRRHGGRRAAATAARHEQQRDQAESRRAPRRDRPSRAEPLRIRRRLRDRPRRGGRLREPHRHVPRRHDGRGLGLLRHRPDGRDRLSHAGRVAVAAAHPRAPGGARRRRHRPARGIAVVRATRLPSIAIASG